MPGPDIISDIVFCSTNTVVRHMFFFSDTVELNLEI